MFFFLFGRCVCTRMLCQSKTKNIDCWIGISNWISVIVAFLNWLIVTYSWMCVMWRRNEWMNMASQIACGCFFVSTMRARSFKMRAVGRFMALCAGRQQTKRRKRKKRPQFHSFFTLVASSECRAIRLLIAFRDTHTQHTAHILHTPRIAHMRYTRAATVMRWQHVWVCVCVADVRVRPVCHTVIMNVRPVN